MNNNFKWNENERNVRQKKLINVKERSYSYLFWRSCYWISYLATNKTMPNMLKVNITVVRRLGTGTGSHIVWVNINVPDTQCFFISNLRFWPVFRLLNFDTKISKELVHKLFKLLLEFFIELIKRKKINHFSVNKK